MTEPYDPLPDLIDRAEHRPDGVAQLKNIARLALHWHRPARSEPSHPRSRRC